MADEIKEEFAFMEEDLAKIIIAISEPASEGALVKTAMNMLGLKQDDASAAVQTLEKAGIIAKKHYAVGDMIEAPSAFIGMYRITDKGIELRRRYMQ